MAGIIWDDSSQQQESLITLYNRRQQNFTLTVKRSRKSSKEQKEQYKKDKDKGKSK